MKEYIEREAVLNLLEKINPDDFGYRFDYSAHGSVNECLRGVRYGVKSLPAADVAPVRHAYWIDHHSGGSFCSSCKRWVPYNHHPKYCETCGALMDGKEADHEVSE